MAWSLEISCLETSAEAEALILWCLRGIGDNIWPTAAFLWCLEHLAFSTGQKYPKF